MDVVYRASELGGCSKALIAKRMGYTEMSPPAKFQGYYDRGNDLEEIMRDELTSRGFVIEDAQTVVRVGVSESVAVEGHIDGKIDGKVWECKRVSSQVYKSFVESGWEAKYDLLGRYKWQVSCYMVATGLELRFDVVDGRSVGSDEGLRYHSLYLEKPFYDATQIRVRALGLEAAAVMGELPDVCDKPSYPCPFYYLPGHDATEADVDETMEALVLACVESGKAVKIAKDKDSDLRRDLLTAMGEQSKVRAESATVSVQQSTRTVTDFDRMVGDGIDVAKYQRVEDGSRYVRITPRRVEVTKDGE